MWSIKSGSRIWSDTGANLASSLSRVPPLTTNIAQSVRRASRGPRKSSFWISPELLSVEIRSFRPVSFFSFDGLKLRVFVALIYFVKSYYFWFTPAWVPESSSMIVEGLKNCGDSVTIKDLPRSLTLPDSNDRVLKDSVFFESKTNWLPGQGLTTADKSSQLNTKSCVCRNFMFYGRWTIHMRCGRCNFVL